MVSNTTKVLACVTIVFALKIVTSTAGLYDYSYITSTVEEEVYTAAGYEAQYFPSKWAAVGDAVHVALSFIYKYVNWFVTGEGQNAPRIFGGETDEIELIVASTGLKSLAYIHGEAKRLDNIYLPSNEKPSRIIVVYTLNYLSDIEVATAEHQNLLVVINKLIATGNNQTPQIPVEVKLFCPFAQKSINRIDVALALPSFKETLLTYDEIKAQLDKIDALHDKVSLLAVEPFDFTQLLTNRKIKKIVDVVGGRTNEASRNSHLLAATRRAQIRMMAISILWQKSVRKDLVVLCLDGPSAMDEEGTWTIDDALRYPVDIILSSVWHKNLVNSQNLNSLAYPKILVLDITYNFVRLFDKLLQIATRLNYAHLVEDVRTAACILRTVVLFYYDQACGRMKVGRYPANLIQIQGTQYFELAQ